MKGTGLLHQGMGLLQREPGLRFWLDYVTREGALVEVGEDQALVILPEGLQRAFGLGEEVRVTADPEVAAEEDALLLIPGHPLLDEAAERVLAAGDVGHGFLPWPSRRSPEAASLLERARSEFPVEHGRLDAAGPPQAGYAPILRVGAMVTYTAADRFQEREEVWVDGRSGLPLPESVRRQLGSLAMLPAAETAHQVLAPDWVAALEGAVVALAARAAARAEAIARQSRGARDEEMARAEAYYTEVLASLEQRREAAAEERRELLAARAEAARLERERRLEEIEEKFRVRQEVRLFRVQLLLVPSLWLPVHVRRGGRLYPLILTWFLVGAAFAGVRCPECGAAERLVAGRQRLGCVRCLAASPAAAAPPSREQHGALAASPPSDGPRGAPVCPAGEPVRPGGEPVRPSGEPRRAADESRRPSGEPGRAPGEPRRLGDDPDLPRGKGAEQPPGLDLLASLRALEARARKTGAKVAFDFWQRTAEGRRWPAGKVPPRSPLDVLYELFGPAGPLLAVGLPPSAIPEMVTAITIFLPDRGLAGATTGKLKMGREEYPYTLLWHEEGGKVMVNEVLPYPRCAGLLPSSADRLHPGAATRLFAGAPRPAGPLDAVSAALWEREVPVRGLPFAVRCLAAWRRWAVRAGSDDLAMAAAVASLVARESGLRLPRAALAAAYGVQERQVREACRRLQSAPHLILPADID